MDFSFGIFPQPDHDNKVPFGASFFQIHLAAVAVAATATADGVIALAPTVEASALTTGPAIPFHANITLRQNEILDVKWMYFGDPTKEGTWRIGMLGSNFVTQRLESGVWTSRHLVTPFGQSDIFTTTPVLVTALAPTVEASGKVDVVITGTADGVIAPSPLAEAVAKLTNLATADGVVALSPLAEAVAKLTNRATADGVNANAAPTVEAFAGVISDNITATADNVIALAPTVDADAKLVLKATADGVIAPAPTVDATAKFFHARTATADNVVAPVPTVEASATFGGSQMASSVTHLGYTWTFDKAYPVGQFADGSYWAIGPIKVIGISPTWDGTQNGSEINPNRNNGQKHGFDSRANPGGVSYTSSLNVAIGVSASNPLIVQAGESLVSADSKGSPNPPSEPYVADLNVLTVLGTAPAPGSFRPPYVGGISKAIQYNKSDLDYSKLDKLVTPTSAPSFASLLSDRLARFPRVDHIGQWSGNNVTFTYGQYTSNYNSDVALLLNCNFTNAEKEELLIDFVQTGIDLYGIVQHYSSALWH